MTQVRVNEGLLEGELIHNEYGGAYYSFKGIPYAEPPVGNLRFKAPQPKKPWSGVRSAKEFGPICYQVNLFTKSPPRGEEDCLYLNVYTPNLDPGSPLPVMFWIHGGGFVSGSGNAEFFGPEFLIKHGIILVTINYRLEVLGFLCLDTEQVPGNAGMKDQVAALRWVNKNISSFGGDPNNVTIFGESAGGASVGYHLVSPMTRGLFKRAIAQSGATTCWWAKVFEPRERALALARKLGCDSNDDAEIYEFYKSLPVQSLVSVNVPITFSECIRKGYELNFGIVSENIFKGAEIFFRGDIFEILPQCVHEGVEVMTGYSGDEGVLLYVFSEYQKMIAQANEFPVYFAPKFITLTCPIEQHIEVGRMMKQFYMEKTDSNTPEWERLARFHAMEMFVYGIVHWAKICANRNTVYLYKFTCKSERNVVPHAYGLSGLIGNKTVTCHSDILFYIFNADIDQKVDKDSDTFQLIENTTKLWTNFAKYGNPTPDASLGVKWNPYSLDNEEYLDIGNVLEASTRPDYEEIKFWEDMFRQYAPKFCMKENNLI